MSKSFRTFLVIASAAVCIGAAPLAMSQFGTGDETSGKTLQQTLSEWRDSARAARLRLEAEGRARQERTAAQEAADLNAVKIYQDKFSICERQANDRGLHFLRRASFMHECIASL